MQIFDYKNTNTEQILALGAESAGNFSVFSENKIYFSEDFGDLLIPENFKKYKLSLEKFLKENNFYPNIILTDLHPLYKTTSLGKILAKKYSARHIQVQHHHAHIFSAIGEHFLKTKNYELQTAFGVALDGTGYGADGKIWGGECFAISNFEFRISNQFSNINDRISKQKMQIERIGHLENQVMIGGDLAIQEPARMLLGILAKFLSKKEVYAQIKKYYSAQEFEVLYNQLQQNFNCIETSSTGRILDAVSLLLGFCKNARNYKHEPIKLLEKNSTIPYKNLKSIITSAPRETSLENSKLDIESKFEIRNSKFILETTPLFEYLIKNLHKDKSRLAATAQLYIAQGLMEIIKLNSKKNAPTIFIAGGISNNKIISNYFKSQQKKMLNTSDEILSIPRGDAGLSFGQLALHLAEHPNPRTPDITLGK